VPGSTPHQQDMSFGPPPAGGPRGGKGGADGLLLLSTTVNKLRARTTRLWRREDGVTAVEYALMVAIIALLMVAGFFLLFDNVSTAFNNTGDCVGDATAIDATGCPAPAGGG
jgi:Flp pilus assembly pilin Flp